MPGEEPPAEIKELATWVEGRERLDIGSPEYLELSRKIYAFHADNLYMIGTVGMAPTLYIAKNSIGNVPTEYPPPRSWAGDSPRTLTSSSSSSRHGQRAVVLSRSACRCWNPRRTDRAPARRAAGNHARCG